MRRDRPFFARDSGGEEVCRRWRSGDGHLQWLSDSDRIGLLPGALLRNAELKFLCKPVDLRVETTNSPFTRTAPKGQVLHDPDRPWRGELLRGARHSRPTGGGGSRCVPVHHNLQWLAAGYRRHSQ